MNEEIFLKKVGEKLYKQRAISEITINELSSRTGIDAVNIAAIEMGKSPIYLEDFLQITKAIGIVPAKIIDGID